MTPEKDLNSVERLISIYDLLNKKKMNGNELADKYGVSRRTIDRDIKKMRNAGVELYSYPGGYKIL